MASVQRIAVIGAGASGLCAARHISHTKKFEPVVFEATDHIGGTWQYTDKIDKDDNGFPIQSSMYKNLRTNLPKQVMAFPDFPFSSSVSSFLHHNEVVEYLKDYATKFNLHPYIKLNTLVDEVSVVSGDEKQRFPKWKVKTYCWKSKLYEESIFDGVMVCNGHYAVPNSPNIEGIEKFQGKIIHSHQYRLPDDFADHHVVLFGGKASGTDIALSLCKVAKTVSLSHKGKRFIAPLPENLHQEQPIQRILEDGVEFEDGKVVKCDSIMFCTGYNYQFPFFKNDIVKVTNNRITPLYKHLINIPYPNLSFIGMCVLICPFPMFHCQVLYALAIIEGTVPLLSEEEMLKDEDDDYQMRAADGLPIRGAHVMGEKQWAYNNELADMCGKERINENIRLLYDLCHHRRTYNLQHYKDEEFVLSEKGNFYKVHD